MINFRHIVIEGSSERLIGRNVRTKNDIIHSSGNYLLLILREFHGPVRDLIRQTLTHLK